jgi:hypothetical protein
MECEDEDAVEILKKYCKKRRVDENEMIEEVVVKKETKTKVKESTNGLIVEV